MKNIPTPYDSELATLINKGTEIRKVIAEKTTDEAAKLSRIAVQLQKLRASQAEYIKKAKAVRRQKPDVILYWDSGLEFRSSAPRSPLQSGSGLYDLLDMIVTRGVPTSFECRG